MDIDIDRILLELDEYLPDYDTQICLQSVKGNLDPFYGIGRVTELNHKENEFIVPTFSKAEYTNEVVKSLGMFRARVMKMKFKSCYTYHRDYTKRMHIPLVTNENCFFVLDDEVVRLPANGSSYLIDTTKRHTFVNASMEERIHIVGCIND